MAVFIGAIRKSGGAGKKTAKPSQTNINRLWNEMGYTLAELAEVMERSEKTSPQKALSYYRKKSNPWMAEAVRAIYKI